MAKKLNSDKSHSAKLFELLTYLRSNTWHSVRELSEKIQCDKETIKRLIDKLSSNFMVEERIEGKNRKKYFKIPPQKRDSIAKIKNSDIWANTMACAFAGNLINGQMAEDAKQLLRISSGLNSENIDFPNIEETFNVLSFGSIDYSGHSEIISSLVDGIMNKKKCKIKYEKYICKNRDFRIYYVKPLKLYSYNNTIYFWCILTNEPGKKVFLSEETYSFPIQRIIDVEVTEINIIFPKNFSFEKEFNRSYGLINDGNLLKIEVEFTGWATTYIAERIWSYDQLIKVEDSRLILLFSASSKHEVISWILSFGQNAKILSPDFLIEEVKAIISNLKNIYL